MSVSKTAGRLSLTVAQRQGRSVAVKQYHHGALRVLRPYYASDSAQPEYAIINPGGAYFGGDRYDIDITVEAGASLKLTTQSATKVYRTPHGYAQQEMRIRVAANGICDYLPHQLIIYAGGDYRQHTTVELAPTARLVMAEIITPGWAPDGRWFSFDRVAMTTEVVVGRQLVLVDTLRIVPNETEVLGLGRNEGYSHSGQLLIVEPTITEQLQSQVQEIVDGSRTYSAYSRAGTPTAPCLFIRSLADSTAAISELHLKVLQLIRKE